MQNKEIYWKIQAAKSLVDNIVNLLLIGTCQRTKVLEEADQLLAALDEIEKLSEKID